MSTTAPLWDALNALADTHPLRMAMPGHKGKQIPGLPPELARLDWTELPPTGNLYGADSVVQEVERAWAEFWGADSCLFLTGGSTQGIHTMLRLADSETILVDRVSHRSIHTGLALLGIEPVWLNRPWLREAGVTGPVEPELVERMLLAHPECGAVCVTSPTYYGVCSDIAALSAVCHRHGARLLVDGAHGAHLFLLQSENPYLGADLVTVSAHKTLPAPGQSALLFGQGYSMDQLGEASQIFATSSPSYPMMAALDFLRPWLEQEGISDYRRVAEAVQRLRAHYPSLTEQDAPLDPTRLTLCVADGDGTEAALQRQNIWPEMADRGHVVFILTGSDTEEDLQRLESGLDALGLAEQKRPVSSLSSPPIPRRYCSPREAFLAPRERVPMNRTLGRVAAEQLAPYPPGVPVVAPGEIIDEKVLAYLTQVGYNKRDTIVLK